MSFPQKSFRPDPSGTEGVAPLFQQGRFLLLTLVLVGLSWAFWSTPFLYPIRIFVVLLHELGHALAAVLTGGSVVRIELVAAEGGTAWTQGGSRFLVLNAGYLGSLLFGVAILYASRRTRWAPPTLFVIAAVVLGVTLFYLRPLFSFSFAYGVGASAALWALVRYGGPELQRFVLHLLGVFSCLYAFFDIRDDILNLDRLGGVSDATMLAELTFIPSFVWGIAWIGASLALLYVLRRPLFL